MDMDQASTFLAGSILVMMGIIIIVVGIVFINNLFHRYWQPVKWLRFEYRPVYFDPATGDRLVEQQEPTLEKKDKT